MAVVMASVMNFSASATTPADYVKNEEMTGELMTAKTIFRNEDGHLFRHLRYTYTYDSENRVTSKEAFKWDSVKGKRLLNYILCIRFFIEVHSIVSASRFFHMPTYLRVVIECQSRFFPFFPAFSRNCPDYFLHTSGSSSFRSLSDLGAR